MTNATAISVRLTAMEVTIAPSSFIRWNLPLTPTSGVMLLEMC